MSNLSKLKIKTVVRSTVQDPAEQRRQKLITGINEQLKVQAAALDGEEYEVARKTWTKNEQGEKVLVERMRKVRPWFFEQDGGWYVQCKYGNRAIGLGGGNAVFVKSLKDVKDTLVALQKATVDGELDEAIENTAKNRKTTVRGS